MTLYAGTIVDTPGDPFAGDPADALAEVGALLVREGVICARGTFAALHAEHPDEPVTQLHGGMLVPGFIDTHVHFPQIRAIGGLGLSLLDWLERCALPEESRLADRAYAREVAGEFFDGLIASGTLPGRHGRAVRRGRAARAEHHFGPGAQRPDPAP